MMFHDELFYEKCPHGMRRIELGPCPKCEAGEPAVRAASQWQAHLDRQRAEAVARCRVLFEAARAEGAASVHVQTYDLGRLLETADAS